MSVSSEIANRIDDSSSTNARTRCEEDLTRRPWVETDMKGARIAVQQKGRAIPKDGPALFRVCFWRLVHSNRNIGSAQAGNVVRNSLDFAVVELGSHPGHDRVVIAHTVTKPHQLRSGVVRMLRTQPWKLDRDP